MQPWTKKDKKGTTVHLKKRCATLQQALALTPNQRAMLATRAMSHVAQHFTREIMCDQTMNVYAELLKNTIFKNGIKNAAE